MTLRSGSSPHDDPTGVHELLRSLPEPPPMPDDVAERILTRLHEESRSRTRPGPVVGAQATETATPQLSVVPGGASPAWSAGRRRSRLSMSKWTTGGLIAAAASAAIVGVLGVNNLMGKAGGERAIADSAALIGGHRPTYTASSVPVSGSASAGSTSTSPSSTAASGTPRFVITETAYTSTNLPDQAGRLRTTSVTDLHTLAGESPALGPLTTDLGLRSCLRTLSVPGEPVIADFGTYDGTPVVVVVTSGTPDTAYVLPRGCGDGAHLVAGPVDLP